MFKITNLLINGREPLTRKDRMTHYMNDDDNKVYPMVTRKTLHDPHSEMQLKPRIEDGEYIETPSRDTAEKLGFGYKKAVNSIRQDLGKVPIFDEYEGGVKRLKGLSGFEAYPGTPQGGVKARFKVGVGAQGGGNGGGGSQGSLPSHTDSIKSREATGPMKQGAGDDAHMYSMFKQSLIDGKGFEGLGNPNDPIYQRAMTKIKQDYPHHFEGDKRLTPQENRTILWCR
jgi:hypothetical protein